MTSFAGIPYSSLWSSISWWFFNSWQLLVPRPVQFPCIATMISSWQQNFILAPCRYLPGLDSLPVHRLLWFAIWHSYKFVGCGWLVWFFGFCWFGLVFIFCLFVLTSCNSQLIRELLCSSPDWEFTLCHQGDIQFSQIILEFMKVQGQCCEIVLGKGL